MKKKTDILFLLPSLLGFFTFFIVPFLYSFCQVLKISY